MASAYGLTPDEFLSFTPRQLEIVIEVLNIRSHNDKAFLANINGAKMDYINPEIKALEREIEARHAAEVKARTHVGS